MEATRASDKQVVAQRREEVPWEPEIAPDGVDLGQIRSMLALAPSQRLERLQDFLDGVLALRGGRKSA